ncbi:MAG TPA: ABC transporter ATP-binding protein [Polyangiaceae bacterium]|jgi:ABC-2 type transport system ATP-binding protein|nr:ABC transporter ATP-binding protein [Polyangiaceae bacterium]
MVILDARDITKILGRRVVLREASLTLQRGERVVVLGENGSGKSTLLQIVGGVLSLDQGQLELRGRLGFAPEKPDIPEHLLVGEWLDVLASLKGLKHVGELPFGVAELSGTRVSALSLGQRQRVSLASAWLGAPELLVLDEPTNGLDAQTQAEVVARLSGWSALIATHDRAFADAVATRVVSVRAGALS